MLYILNTTYVMHGFGLRSKGMAIGKVSTQNALLTWIPNLREILR